MHPLSPPVPKLVLTILHLEGAIAVWGRREVQRLESFRL